MPLTLIGLAGSLSRPSRTRALIETIVDRVAVRTSVSSEVFDLVDVGASLGSARRMEDLDARARRIADALLSADALVVATPVYKGSYTGLFKHFFDLYEPSAFASKPILLAASGGGDRHALIIEHQLRPLFGFFEAQTLPTGVYAADRDFGDGRPAAPALLARIDQAVDQLRFALSGSREAPFLPAPAL